MKGRYIFAVYTGRAGGEQTTQFFQRNVIGAVARNEYPSYSPTLPSPFDQWQRKFHRNFIESDELLGRGKVIHAFVQNDKNYIEKIARRRWMMIQREMEKPGSEVFFDISKAISRGMHTVLDQFIPSYSVLFIVRDPIRNMRSFLNRGKNFLLDNNLPDDNCNELVMNSTNFHKGEFYLWMWCELHLRYQRILSSPNVAKTAILRTENMNNVESMKIVLDSLDLPYGKLSIELPTNTNIRSGYSPTLVTESDVRIFEKFIARVPDSVLQKVSYLDTYNPWSVLSD
jgi:hypothetical protein